MKIKYDEDMELTDLALQFNRKRITAWAVTLMVMAAVLVKMVYDAFPVDNLIIVFAVLTGIEILRTIDSNYKSFGLLVYVVAFVYFLGYYQVNILAGALIGLTGVVLGFLFQQVLYLIGSKPYYSKAFSVFPYPKSFTRISDKDMAWFKETVVDPDPSASEKLYDRMSEEKDPSPVTEDEGRV